jgi:predicted Ser/Thr protein kinase
MRDPRLFQLNPVPGGGKVVYHRSPSGRKVTRNVPNTVVTKRNAVRFLQETGGRGQPRTKAVATATKFIVRPNGTRIPLKPRLAPLALNCGALKHLKGFRKIGSGRQGVIYAAEMRPNYFKKEIAIKVAPFDKASERRGEAQPAQIEYNIHRAAQIVAWGGVVRLMSMLQNCTDFAPPGDMSAINSVSNRDVHRQAVIFMERADGGTMKQWLRDPKRTDKEVLDAVATILYTLHLILKAHPEFRHNDLHLDNILMFKNAPKIADFGWARIKKTGTNPAVNTALENGTAARYGIGPDTDPRYDSHLFLNEVRRQISAAKFPRSWQFLTRAIPTGYREFRDSYTVDGRLKYGVELPGLPTLEQLMKDPVMKAAKNTLNRRKTPSPPKPPPPARNSPPRSPVAPVKKRSASPRKNYTNADFLTMTPRRFLKLSPITRARAAAIRKAGKGKAPVMNNKPRGNNATAKRMPSPKRAPTKAAVRISPRTLRSNKFNRLVTSLLNFNNSQPYQNRWNAARTKAMKILEGRVEAGRPAFSPSPVKRARLPSPLSPIGPPPVRRSPPRRSPAGVVKSAGSGRFKVAGPSGRLVYADGSTVSMNFLKGLAARKGVNTKGLRSKDAIAKAIFNRANK